MKKVKMFSETGLSPFDAVRNMIKEVEKFLKEENIQVLSFDHSVTKFEKEQIESSSSIYSKKIENSKKEDRYEATAILIYECKSTIGELQDERL